MDGRYTILPASSVSVTADAPGHKFRARGAGVTGEIEISNAMLVSATARFPLHALDAGDRLSNHELKKFLGVSDDRPRFAEGWVQPGHQVGLASDRHFGRCELSIRCEGAPKMGAPMKAEIRPDPFGSNVTITLDASFTALGYSPPKLLFLKVADRLAAEITLVLAAPSGLGSPP